MSIRQMSIAMQRLVDLISMVTNSTLLHNNTGVVTTILFVNEMSTTIPRSQQCFSVLYLSRNML
jgi:hypothetical protein